MQLKTDEQKHSAIMDETWLNLRKTRQSIPDLIKVLTICERAGVGVCSK